MQFVKRSAVTKKIQKLMCTYDSFTPEEKERKKHSYYRNNKEYRESLEIMYEHCYICQDTESEIEHVAPKKNYTEKAADINNLLLICSTCNRAKGNRYIAKLYIDVTDEKNRDIIENKIIYSISGHMGIADTATESERRKIEYMIDLHKLNRRGLVKKRREIFHEIFGKFQKDKTMKIREKSEFSGVKKYYLKLLCEVFKDE